MSDDSKSRCLSYKASPFTALVITVMSLFMQWFIWFAYEKLDKEWYFNLVTPLVLCMMYHFVQLDAGKNGNFSRKFFFIFSIIVPLSLGVAVTLLIYVMNSDISVFNMDKDYEGTAKEIVITYAGRFIYTSLYMLIFAVIDIPVLRSIGRKGKDT